MIGVLLAAMLQAPAPTMPPAFMVDLAAVGIHDAVEVIPIEADGDRMTAEYLLNGIDPSAPTFGLVAIVAVRNDQVCVGPWSDARPTTTVYWSGVVVPFTDAIYWNSGHDWGWTALGRYVPACPR